ncbi:MAG TPA: hypothetical protein VFV34_21445, partial [Blastocatellia bacterium]|nr:hypothetical protein [Blastocatellia bacterium]
FGLLNGVTSGATSGSARECPPLEGGMFIEVVAGHDPHPVRGAMWCCENLLILFAAKSRAT